MDKNMIKQISCEFFRYWWNEEGNNTEEAFDKWWDETGKTLVKKSNVIPDVSDQRGLLMGFGKHLIKWGKIKSTVGIIKKEVNDYLTHL